MLEASIMNKLMVSLKYYLFRLPTYLTNMKFFLIARNLFRYNWSQQLKKFEQGAVGSHHIETIQVICVVN